MVTPVRCALGATDEHITFLRNTDSGYRDGGEPRVLEILTAASDLSSTSEELIGHARTWAEQYHLSPVRANLLRPLRLPRRGRVLEVGAGCGAVTRYLAENCAVVDALEPVPGRARCIAARTRDLPGVHVFVGEIGDVPAERSYDLIVVVGVLEYVGAGSRDADPYREFLAALEARLAPGGTVLLAIENKLGVKYLAGAPEDHTDRIFDSLEGYPFGGQARTFSRRELAAMLGEVGLHSRVGIVFPDYKMPRAVFMPDLLSPRAEPMLIAAPRFPSPDWVSQREPLADERLLWSTLVHAGLALDTGNSFLVLATSGDTSELWDETSCGAVYSDERRPKSATETLVLVADGAISLRRSTPSLETAVSGLTTVDVEFEIPSGTMLLDIIGDLPEPTLVDLLGCWISLLDRAMAAAGDRGAPWSLIPSNLVLDVAGQLFALDDGWRTRTANRATLIQRGILILGVDLADRSQTCALVAECPTYRGLVVRLGTVVGLPADGAWLATAIAEEAVAEAAIRLTHVGQDPAAAAASVGAHISALLDRDARRPQDFGSRMRAFRSATTVAEAGIAAAGERAASHLARAVGAEDRVRELEQAVAAGQLAADQLRGTVSWRLTAPLRKVRILAKRRSAQ